MKKFKDLKSGEVVYIIGVNLSSGIMFNRAATFDHFISEKSKVTEDPKEELSKAKIKFQELTETSIEVILDSVRARNANNIVGTEIYYFSDVLVAETFLKDIRDKLFNILHRIDEIYSNIWKDKEESDKNRTPDKYELGDILFSNSFSESCIYVGDNIAVFGDGVLAREVTEESTRYRRATQLEIDVFMKKCTDTMESKQKKIYNRIILDSMIKCGYKYNKDKKIFEKTEN